MLLASTLVIACDDQSAADADVPPSGGKADGIGENIPSPNADPEARYLQTRSVEALKTVGALSPLQERIIDRVLSYHGAPKEFGVEALLLAETPARYATFLPEERAAFPSLWELLAIDDSLELDDQGPFVALADRVEIVEPEPMHLDELERVEISALAPELQEAASRVIKTLPGADTIAYAEVLNALANYQDYTSAEYFRFGSLLREIERVLASPQNFPHLAYEGPLEQEERIEVGDAAVVVSQSVKYEQCATPLRSTGIATAITIEFEIPTGSYVTWTPVSSSANLFRLPDYPRPVDVVSAASGTVTYRIKGGDERPVAIVEEWRDGARVAQSVALLPKPDGIYGEGLAIVQDGALRCLPFAAYATSTDSLSNVGRLPPGRYPIPIDGQDDLVLNLYGLGVMRLESAGESFWKAQPPTPMSSVTSMCWSNGILEPGPEVPLRYVYATNEVWYGSCYGGTLGTVLSPNDRL